MGINKLFKVYCLSYVVFLLFIVLTKTQEPVDIVNHSTGIIKDHTVTVQADTMSKPDTVSDSQNSDQSGLNFNKKPPLRFGCRKQVPLYSLRKGRWIQSQNTEPPFRIIVEPQNVRPGEQVKGNMQNLFKPFADPESFVRGGPIYDPNTTISGPSDGVSLAVTLFFVIFQGGGSGPLSPL